ncbi:MAG TPA: YicC/YloC family endoribonuclease [Candidatus Binatia bacterium]|nr:YicC/YloC family endoribonuclease [Candidatus Binatia bacterium]
MKSMTGYGEGSQSIRGAKVTVQIRSLNHRHLDLQLRVPREYLSLEEEIRKALREKISRGRIDLFVNRYGGKGSGRKLDMDESLVGQYIAGVKQLKKRYGLAGEVGVSLLSNIPDLVHVREPEADPAGERRTVMKALAAALNKLERSREREGGQLRADMESQIRHLSRIAVDLEGRVAENPLRVQRGAAPDGQNGTNGDREPGDLSNVSLKGDVNEEIVRLKTHVATLAKVIREREPVGKKIDFMLQEVNRELNTISSKVPYLPVVQLVLQGKERVEKIREQAQNVE